MKKVVSFLLFLFIFSLASNFVHAQAEENDSFCEDVYELCRIWGIEVALSALKAYWVLLQCESFYVYCVMTRIFPRFPFYFCP